MNITDYHSKYFAHELTKRRPADSVEKLAGAVASAQVELNPRQVEDWEKGIVQNEERYALAAAFEDRTRNDVRFYAQLRAKLRQRVRARVEEYSCAT